MLRDTSYMISLLQNSKFIAEEMGRSPEDVMLRYDFKIARKRGGSWSREEVSVYLDAI